MFVWDYNIFLGDNADDVHVDVATDDNVFIIAEIAAGDEEGRLKSVLDKIKADIKKLKPESLSAFSSLITKRIDSVDDDLVACAAGLVVDSVLYLFTRGNGVIYISRGGNVQKLIEGDNTASGPIEQLDYFLLTNKTFTDQVDDSLLRKLMFNAKPQEIVETLTPDLKGNNDTGMVALFMQAQTKDEDEVGALITEEIEDEDINDAEASAKPQKDDGDSAESPEDADDLVDSDDADEDSDDVDDDVDAAAAADGVVGAADDVEGEETDDGSQDNDALADSDGATEDRSSGGVMSDGSIPSDGDVLSGEQMSPDSQTGYTQQPAKRLTFIPESLRLLMSSSSRGKKITLIITVVLIIVLGYSVISGQSRRNRAAFEDKVAEQQQIIQGKLDEADDLVGVNTQKALQLIDESRVILTSLKKEAESKNIEGVEELGELETLINQSEQGIRKIEEGEFSEYYDLNLIEKGAAASALYLEDGSLGMLNTDSGDVYILDVAEKSVDTLSSSKARDAVFIALHRGEAYVYGDEIGVVKLPADGSAEEVVSPDSDLKDVRDMWMYSGNIYLLAAGNDEIYKYLVAEEGYSGKRSYFGSGQAIDLKDASAMAIDASIYISSGGNVHKYISGARIRLACQFLMRQTSTMKIYSQAQIPMLYICLILTQHAYLLCLRTVILRSK